MRNLPQFIEPTGSSGEPRGYCNQPYPPNPNVMREGEPYQHGATGPYRMATYQPPQNVVVQSHQGYIQPPGYPVDEAHVGYQMGPGAVPQPVVPGPNFSARLPGIGEVVHQNGHNRMIVSTHPPGTSREGSDVQSLTATPPPGGFPHNLAQSPYPSVQPVYYHPEAQGRPAGPYHQSGAPVQASVELSQHQRNQHQLHHHHYHQPTGRYMVTGMEHNPNMANPTPIPIVESPHSPGRRSAASINSPYASNLPQVPRPIDDEEVQKMKDRDEKRKLRNRMAQRRARQKQKDDIATLENKLKAEKKTTMGYRKKVRELEKTVKKLQRQMMNPHSPLEEESESSSDEIDDEEIMEEEEGTDNETDDPDQAGCSQAKRIRVE